MSKPMKKGEQSEPIKLPKTILRPMRRAYLAIGVVLAGFLIWSVSAPLATTIHTNGNLQAKTPSFDIQHPFGGKISKVFVSEHDEVKSGQTLIEIDVINEQAQLSELVNQIDILQLENQYLQKRLAGEVPKNTGNGPKWLIERLQAMEATTSLEVQAMRSNQTALAMQAASLSERLAANEDRLASMQERHDDQKALVRKGAFKSSDAAELNETILSLAGDMNSDHSQLIGIREEIRQVDISATRSQNQLRSTLLEIYAGNQKALPDLRRRRLDLEGRIAAAKVKAPSSGVVTVLTYDTDQMFAPRGETLLKLTRPTESYQVAFTVSPQMIDQLSVGMVGQVTVGSLPQRNLPKVHAEIVALSPEAQRDQEGNVVGYAGTAQLKTEDMDRLFKVLDHSLRLSIDMPVTVAFPGRTTTFADYLVSPFLAFLDRSLQD